jgi:hypothetical protein
MKTWGIMSLATEKPQPAPEPSIGFRGVIYTALATCLAVGLWVLLKLLGDNDVDG